MTGPRSYGFQDVIEWAESLPPSAEPERACPIVDRSESPIESAMVAALRETGFGTHEQPKLGAIYQQRMIGPCRVDVAIVRRVGDRAVRLVVELDGHEFHHATKEQVERDYQRDRELARAGWIVVHFTGSEVWRDAGACALEVAGIVIDAVDRIRGGR